MNKNFFRITALTTFLLASTTFLNARPASDDNQPSRQSILKPGQMRKALNLTDEQTAKIKTEFAAQKDTLKAQAHKVRDARTGLREAIYSGAPETQIRNAATAVGTAEGDLAMERAALFARIKPILTAEQLAKLQTLQSKHPRH
ncbi:MAG: hypothetical protein IPP19_12325 [Verrucomicrobia bacterium]|nr:hypothetical protein [Verrucomicrobiota bacterium]